MSYWTFGTSALVILAGVACWLVSAWICLANWSRRKRRSSAVLESLRLLIVTGLIFTLFKPEHVRLIEETDPPAVVVLADESGSMETQDIDLGTNVLTRSAWLTNELAKDYWSRLNITGELHQRAFSGTSTNAGTDIQSALQDVIGQYPHLKAVVLLSDGDWNQGSPPAGAALTYREKKIPVYTSAIGSARPLPDLSLERIDPPAYGLVGEQVAIPFRIRSTLSEPVDLRVELKSKDRSEGERSLVVPSDSEFQDAVVWSPEQAGDYELTVEIPVQPGERIRTNNVASFHINIRSEILRVLIMDSQPRWEYRFLRNALERDPGVDMDCILFHPGMANGEGPHYLPAFPGTKELLSEYDVIFLGDVPIGAGGLSKEDAGLIRGLVENQSSGLVFLPGNLGHHFSWADSPLGDLLPVSFDQARKEGVGLRNESLLELSSIGSEHWLTRFDSNPTRNAAIWQQLPGFYWSTAVEKSRPGSRVLAVHSNLRNDWGRMPLLVTRQAGSGKVLFMGTDSAWRWRRGVEDKYHYRFWSQVARWMAHQRHIAGDQGIRLSYSPQNPKVGDTVFLQATVLDASGYPVDQDEVNATIAAPGSMSQKVQLNSLSKGWGVYSGSFIPETGGPHEIKVTAREAGRELELSLMVSQPVIEKTGRPIRSDVLEEVSRITLAENVSMNGLEALVDQIQLLPEPDPTELRYRLWASPAWGGVLLFLLALYWCGRKLAGLI